MAKRCCVIDNSVGLLVWSIAMHPLGNRLKSPDKAPPSKVRCSPTYLNARDVCQARIEHTRGVQVPAQHQVGETTIVQERDVGARNLQRAANEHSTLAPFLGSTGLHGHPRAEGPSAHLSRMLVPSVERIHATPQAPLPTALRIAPARIAPSTPCRNAGMHSSGKT
jgi:hypothetical protein